MVAQLVVLEKRRLYTADYAWLIEMYSEDEENVSTESSWDYATESELSAVAI